MDGRPTWHHALFALACSVSLAAAAAASAPETDPDDPSADLHLFSGGLLLHLTPLQIRGIEDVEVGVAPGLGGGAHFYIGRHVRVGGMGGSSSMTFGEHDSKYRSVMGAFEAFAALPIGPVDLTLGLAIGGQSMTVHHYRAPLDEQTYEVERFQRTGFVLLPMAGVEIPISRKVRILTFVHYHHPHWLGDFNGHTVRIHVGVWFNTFVPRPARRDEAPPVD